MTLSNKTKHIIESLDKDLQNSIIDCFNEQYQNKETDHYQLRIWSYANMVLRREYNDQKQPSEMFFKIDILKNLAYFTGRYLCWSLF